MHRDKSILERLDFNCKFDRQPKLILQTTKVHMRFVQILILNSAFYVKNRQYPIFQTHNFPINVIGHLVTTKRFISF